MDLSSLSLFDRILLKSQVESYASLEYETMDEYDQKTKILMKVNLEALKQLPDEEESEDPKV